MKSRELGVLEAAYPRGIPFDEIETALMVVKLLGVSGARKVTPPTSGYKAIELPTKAPKNPRKGSLTQGTLLSYMRLINIPSTAHQLSTKFHAKSQRVRSVLWELNKKGLVEKKGHSNGELLWVVKP